MMISHIFNDIGLVHSPNNQQVPHIWQIKFSFNAYNIRPHDPQDLAKYVYAKTKHIIYNTPQWKCLVFNTSLVQSYDIEIENSIKSYGMIDNRTIVKLYGKDIELYAKLEKMWRL